MIAIVLLGLPVACLLTGIVYSSVNLWKLSKKTVSSYISTSSVPLCLDEGGDQVVPQSLVIADGIRIANTYELDEKEMYMLLCSLILKQQQKSLTINNCYKISLSGMMPWVDLGMSTMHLLFDNEKQAKHNLAVGNKEKFLCQLQNFG